MTDQQAAFIVAAKRAMGNGNNIEEWTYLTKKYYFEDLGFEYDRG